MYANKNCFSEFLGQLHNLSVVLHNYAILIDLLLQLQLGNTELRLLRIYGNSIERKDYVGPYYNKDVRTYMAVCIWL